MVSPAESVCTARERVKASREFCARDRPGEVILLCRWLSISKLRCEGGYRVEPRLGLGDIAAGGDRGRRLVSGVSGSYGPVSTVSRDALTRKARIRTAPRLNPRSTLWERRCEGPASGRVKAECKTECAGAVPKLNVEDVGV